MMCDVMIILLFNKIIYVMFYIYIYMKNKDLLEKYII